MSPRADWIGARGAVHVVIGTRAAPLGTAPRVLTGRGHECRSPEAANDGQQASGGRSYGVAACVTDTVATPTVFSATGLAPLGSGALSDSVTSFTPRRQASAGGVHS